MGWSGGIGAPVSTIFLNCEYQFKTRMLLEFDVFNCLNVLN